MFAARFVFLFFVAAADNIHKQTKGIFWLCNIQTLILCCRKDFLIMLIRSLRQLKPIIESNVWILRGKVLIYNINDVFKLSQPLWVQILLQKIKLKLKEQGISGALSRKLKMFGSAHLWQLRCESGNRHPASKNEVNKAPRRPCFPKFYVLKVLHSRPQDQPAALLEESVVFIVFLVVVAP